MSGFIQSTFMDGYVGGPHIEETQVRQANQAAFGPDDYVLEGGREAEAQILTNNSIRIFDAVYCMQGGRDVIAANDYTDVTISNGAQGVNRNDIIVRRYQKDESSEVESMEYAVIKGTPTSGTATDPDVTVGDIRNGATLHEMKLYRVKIQGLNIVAVEPLFKVLYNKKTIQDKITELNRKYIVVEKTYMKNVTAGQLYFTDTIAVPAGYKVASAWARASHASTLCGAPMVSEATGTISIPYVAGATQNGEEFYCTLVCEKAL